MNRRMLMAAAGAIAITTVAACAPMSPQPDIVDIAAGNQDFSTLVAAVQAAGLVETLKSEGPFTLFAPTNDAFAELPPGTVESLLKPENKAKLVTVLTYHIVPGKVMSADLAGKVLSAPTMQGGLLDIEATDGVTVNGSSVTVADISASNGVIHVIDSVLLPWGRSVPAALLLRESPESGRASGTKLVLYELAWIIHWTG